MKLTLGFCLLMLVCVTSAEIEVCTDVSSCSESLKSKCNEMSESLKESGGDQKLALACRNGVCMCNIEFEKIVTNPEPTEANAEMKETDDGKEVEKTKSP